MQEVEQVSVELGKGVRTKERLRMYLPSNNDVVRLLVMVLGAGCARRYEHAGSSGDGTQSYLSSYYRGGR